MKNKFALLFAIFAMCFFIASCSDDDNHKETEVEIPETYQLPVVVHVLYTDASNQVENVPSEIIYDILERTNKMLRNTTTSINMNVQLVAATTDPSGKPLAEKGIHRVLRSDANRIECDSFMHSNKAKDVELVWNPNNYVNVFIYSFAEENVLGIAHLPYTPTSNKLPGLHATDTYYNKSIDNVWGISMNNLFFYTLNETSTGYVYDKEAYNTLTHELGHYLGLFHAFSDSDCSDTDYCDDTPNYNRAEYVTRLLDITQNHPDEYTWSNVVNRTACDGTTFVSHNIMDYDFSYFDQYTPDQRTRVRHVLENSSLIPGPKKPRTGTRSATSEEKPPIITIRCTKHHH